MFPAFLTARLSRTTVGVIPTAPHGPGPFDSRSLPHYMASSPGGTRVCDVRHTCGEGLDKGVSRMIDSRATRLGCPSRSFLLGPPSVPLCGTVPLDNARVTYACNLIMCRSRV